jgi:hypothetical protein
MTRARHRAIRALSDATGLSRERIGVLLERELARLGPGAKVHSYLLPLAAANVRTALSRGLWQRPGESGAGMSPDEMSIEVQIERWETEGGSGAWQLRNDNAIAM